MGIFGKAYFGRKVEEGKNKLAVLNALGNKLLNCIFSVVKQGTKWEAEISKVKETPLLKDSPHKPPPPPPNHNPHLQKLCRVDGLTFIQGLQPLGKMRSAVCNTDFVAKPF
jgi:hypothetical protein